MFFKADSALDPSKKIIIYGAGLIGISVFCTLLNEDYRVDCFCDKDPLKQRVHIMNKAVISPEALCSTYNNEQIVIGVATDSQKIKQFLTENKIPLENIFECSGDLSERIMIGKVTVIPEKWYSLIKVSQKKRIYIFGDGEEEKILKRKMELDDIACDRMIAEDADLSFIDKEKSMLVTVREDKEKFKKLEEAGFERKRNYRPLWDMREINEIDDLRKQVPDITLGINYDFGSGYPGYAVLGDDNSYRIMVLGSSTSHEGYFSYDSWPKMLYGLLSEKGYSVQIFNGAIRAYTIQMMLAKCIRDLPDIKPDLIICYSGGENSGMYGYTKPSAPFLNSYMKDVFKNASVTEKKYVNYIEGVRTTIEEEDEANQLAKDYLYSCDVLKGVCDAFGIPLLNFFYCHAGMCDTKNLKDTDREAAYHYRWFMKSEHDRKRANDFYKLVKTRMKPWSFDHTELFKDMDDVYIDAIHVNEKGNRIIAKDVYSRVVPYFPDSTQGL